MKQPALLTFVCPTCNAAYRALPGSRITCAHGNTTYRLRPAVVATPSNQPTLTTEAMQ